MHNDSVALATKGFLVMKRKETSGNDWHYIKRKNGVAVLALTKKGEIIFVTQRRPIINKTLLEIPAGGIEEGRSLIQEAKRELQEETGFYPKKIKKLIEIYPTPGYYTEKTSIFLATDLAEKKKNPTKEEKNNQLRVVKKTIPQVLRAITKGEINDAKTIVAVLFYLKDKG